MSENLEEIIKERTGRALELSGGFELYADALQISEDELETLIRNKKVIDLGSSKSLFAKECIQRKIPTEIISISPRLALKSFRDSEKELTRDLNEGKRQVKQIQKKHDATAVSAFAQELPFKSESIDIILDCFAVFNYADLNNFTNAVKESLRVLKRGGEIRMVSAALNDKFLNERENELRELQIPFEEIKNKAGDVTIGFRIVKLN